MNFTEVNFWIVLVLGLALISVVRLVVKAAAPGALPMFERVALATLSLTLLLGVGTFTFMIFVSVAIITYTAARLAAKCSRGVRRAVLWLVAPLVLAPI